MNKRPLFYSNTIYLKINDQSTTTKNQIKRFKQKNEKKGGIWSLFQQNGSTVRALGKPEYRLSRLL